MVSILSFALSCCLLVAFTEAQPAGLKSSTVCTREGPAGTVLTVRATVRPPPNYDYNQCRLLNYNAYVNNNQYEYIEASQCNPTVNIAADGSVTVTVTESGSTTAVVVDQATNCGWKQVSTVYRFAMLCSMMTAVTMANDVVVKFGCDALDTGETLFDKLTLSASVGDIPKLTIERSYSVTMSFVDLTYVPFATAQPLGTQYRLMMCFSGNLPSFDVGFAPVAVYGGACAVSQGDDVTTPVAFMDANSCPTPNPSSPINLFPTNQYAWRFISTQSSGNRDLIPNCLATEPIELKTFTRKAVGPVLMSVECDVELCFSLVDSDGRCDGARVSEADTNPDYSCVTVAKKRKRRSSSQFPGFEGNNTIPERVQASLLVKPETLSDLEKADCFDKTTFVALASVLGILLLIVLLVAGFLFCHLMKTSRRDRRDDRSSSSTVSGIPNKGFY